MTRDATRCDCCGADCCGGACCCGPFCACGCDVWSSASDDQRREAVRHFARAIRAVADAVEALSVKAGQSTAAAP
jgi:hypothetical protein